MVKDQIAKQKVKAANARFVKLLLFLKKTIKPKNISRTATRPKIKVITVLA